MNDKKGKLIKHELNIELRNMHTLPHEMLKSEIRDKIEIRFNKSGDLTLISFHYFDDKGVYFFVFKEISNVKELGIVLMQMEEELAEKILKWYANMDSSLIQLH